MERPTLPLAEPVASGAARELPITSVRLNTLTFGPTETSKTITVAVCGDTTFENDEIFIVKLFGAVNATITKDEGVGTISER